MCKTQLLSNENQPTSEEDDIADEKDSYLINMMKYWLAMDGWDLICTVKGGWMVPYTVVLQLSWEDRKRSKLKRRKGVDDSLVKKIDGCNKEFLSLSSNLCITWTWFSHTTPVHHVNPLPINFTSYEAKYYHKKWHVKENLYRCCYI